MYVRLLPLFVVMLFIGGCANHKLVDCQKQNEKLKADLMQTQQHLQDETTKHKTDVEKLNKESQEMQTQAMQSMTTMLKKDQDSIEKLKAKITELETKVKAQSEENEKLKSSIAEMEKKANPVTPAK